MLNKEVIKGNKKAIAILGCDSMFEFKGKGYGKPKNEDEALKRLLMMSSESGILHTGHCFIYRKKIHNQFREESFSGVIKNVISTRINFSSINNVEILITSQLLLNFFTLFFCTILFRK